MQNVKMRTICAGIYLVLLVILLPVVASEARKSSNEDWQYLVVAQQWPTTVCLSEKKHKCQIPSYVSSWAVHGLWPSSKHSSPGFCNRSLAFNATVLKPIEDKLLAAWPNLFTDENIYTFWKHEWTKHGTCAVTVPQLDTELKYFSEATERHKLYNILKYLEDSDIIPDDYTSYPVDRFKAAVESKIGKRTLLHCRNVKGYEFPLILSIYICLDKDLTLIDCQEKANDCKSPLMYLPLRSTNTHTHFKPIYYVAIAFALLVIIGAFIWFFVCFKQKSKHTVYSVLA